MTGPAHLRQAGELVRGAIAELALAERELAEPTRGAAHIAATEAQALARRIFRIERVSTATTMPAGTSRERTPC